MAENETMEMTKEEKKALVRQYEDDILGGLIAAASYKEDEAEIVPVEIVRGNSVVLKFSIHPLSEDDYLNARREHTVYKRNKQLGTKVTDHVDTARYRAQLIYDATIEADQEKIWKNRKAWEKLAVLSAIDLIEVVLKGGEKDAIIDKIDEISGYSATTEETVKN